MIQVGLQSSTQPRTPPEKPEAEASLLGAILVDPSLYEAVVRGRIGSGGFSRAPHQHIFDAMEAVAAAGEAPTYPNVQAELARQERLDLVGGAQFLVGLMQAVPTVAHAETYTRIVERTALLRRLLGAANAIARLALTQPAPEALEEAQKLLFGVGESAISRDVVSAATAILNYTSQIEARIEGQPTGVLTGLKTLDLATGGFQKSDLIILAGRPSLGKTSLALSFATHAASQRDQVIAIFSLEMTEEKIVQRMISMISEIDGTRMRHGRLSFDELGTISMASGQLQAGHIYTNDSTRITVNDVLAKCRRLQAERGLNLVIIDYLQLIETRGQSRQSEENRVQEVGRITRSLKIIARELQVPVVALSQMSRQIETRLTEPMLSDLRESGSIEQDADIVMFLWRPKSEKDQNVIRLKLAKHRNGPTAEIDLYFKPEHTRFRDLGEATDFAE